MLRLVRAVAIGGGAGIAVGGSLYVWQQQRLARNPQPVHLCSEWGFETRNEVLRASVTARPEDRAKHLERALDSITSARTNLSTKSGEWLGSYGDLLRSLALARAEARMCPEDIMDPLRAARTIPLGRPALTAAAAALAFDITGDEAELSNELVLPTSLESTADLRNWAPYAIARARSEIGHSRLQPALAELLKLHRAAGSLEDPLCYRPTASGYIAQLLWRLGRPADARQWLVAGESEASQCGTPACKQTTQVLRELLARASK